VALHARVMSGWCTTLSPVADHPPPEVSNRDGQKHITLGGLLGQLSWLLVQVRGPKPGSAFFPARVKKGVHATAPLPVVGRSPSHWA
jgi:hypothetical protein